MAESPGGRFRLPPCDHFHQSADSMLVLSIYRISVSGMRCDPYGICSGTSAFQGSLGRQPLFPVPAPRTYFIRLLPFPQIYHRFRQSVQFSGKSSSVACPGRRSHLRNRQESQLTQPHSRRGTGLARQKFRTHLRGLRGIDSRLAHESCARIPRLKSRVLREEE